MLLRGIVGIATASRPSISLPVCDVEVLCWLEYFKNNFMAD